MTRCDFGEWLHAKRVAPFVHTVSVNPQIVRGAVHRRDWAALLPLLIDEAVLGRAGAIRHRLAGAAR